MRDDIAGGHERHDIVDVARESDAIADAELRREFVQLPLEVLLVEQRAAGDHAARAGHQRQRAQEHILSLPPADSAEHADERRAIAD